MRRELPRAARWLLERRVPEHEREYVLGDLVEVWRSGGGGVGAHLRLWREVLAMVWRADPDPEATAFQRGPLRDLTLDISLGVRRLRRAPGFTLATALTLALGAGATAAIASVARPALWGPLPFREADRIVTLRERFGDGSLGNVGFATIQDIARRSGTLTDVAAVGYWAPILTEPGRAMRLTGNSVSASWFSAMGVRPAMGRQFREDEARPDGARVVVLTHATWAQLFGSDSTILGRTIPLDGVGHEVIGVMPASYESVLAPGGQLLRPLRYVDTLPQACRSCRHLSAVARLRDGVTMQRAQEDLAAISTQFAREYPTEHGQGGMVVTGLRAQLGEGVRAPMLALLGAAGVLLLIALANTTNLFVARALQRRNEGLVRTALGARRWRLLRAYLVEAALVAVVGALFAAALATWALDVLLALAPASLPRVGQVTLGAAGVTWVVVLSLGVALTAAVLSMGVAVGAREATSLTLSTRSIARGGLDLVRRGLVAGEVALALVLLVGTGVLVQSVQRLLRVDPGFEVEGRTSVLLSASGPRYADDALLHQAWRDVLSGVGSLPGVTAVALSSQLPLANNFDAYGLRWEGRETVPGEASDAFRYAVSPGYADVMGLRVLQGRFLAEGDVAGSDPVVVVSQGVARRLAGGGGAVGARVRMGGGDTPLRTVVGVVEDVRHPSLDGALSAGIYLPLTQNHFADNTVRLVVRGDVAMEGLVGAVRSRVAAVDPTITVDEATTLAGLVQRAAAPRRFAERLLQAFALVAVLLSGVGVFGVVAAMVSERVREVGIRAALGASRAVILAHFLRQGGVLAAAGIGAGMVLALLAGRALEPFVFGVSPRDPLTIGGAGAFLGALALAATALPAWRATRIDAADALRRE